MKDTTVQARKNAATARAEAVKRLIDLHYLDFHRIYSEEALKVGMKPRPLRPIQLQMFSEEA